jgi:transcriptional regulator with XRE-family HTH domain
MQNPGSQARHPFRAKLALGDSLRIRSKHAAGTSARDLAAAYGVSVTSIYAVLRGRTHRCVLRVILADKTYTRLAAAAKAAGRSLEDWAANVLSIDARMQSGATQPMEHS